MHADDRRSGQGVAPRWSNGCCRVIRRLLKGASACDAADGIMTWVPVRPAPGEPTAGVLGDQAIELVNEPALAAPGSTVMAKPA